MKLETAKRLKRSYRRFTQAGEALAHSAKVQVPGQSEDEDLIATATNYVTTRREHQAAIAAADAEVASK